MEFIYLVFTPMPGKSYCRRLRSLLLYLCYVFWALINSLVCWFCTSTVFQICASCRNVVTGGVCWEEGQVIIVPLVSFRKRNCKRHRQGYVHATMIFDAHHGSWWGNANHGIKQLLRNVLTYMTTHEEQLKTQALSTHSLHLVSER